jgi:dolichol kinase
MEAALVSNAPEPPGFEGEIRQASARVQSEAPRKAIHLASIIIPLGILYLPLSVSRRALEVFCVLFLVVDLLRLHHPRLRTYFSLFFRRLIRRHERRGLLASTYMLISALLATMLFSREVAAAAYIYLVVGDTVAAIVGKAWGRVRVFGKTLEGFLAGFVASWAAAAALVPSIPLEHLAAGALAAMIVEILPIPVDDNFRIPLLAGVVLEWLR